MREGPLGGRLGFTTGACAAAAAKAAAQVLAGTPTLPTDVEIPFPNGERFILPVEWVRRDGASVEAAVRKDAGDDPDITNGALLVVCVAWGEGHDVTFAAGEGVGTVTKPGLSIPPREPAINPGPRNMIRAAVREVTDRAVRVTVAIPTGRELAQKTFNPRLGIVDGLSILGTTGRVRPFSCEAMRCAVACELDVAKAAGVVCPVLVPGHIGERSAHRSLKLAADQLVEVGNEWGFVLERLSQYPFRRALLWGHPGKLAKLADGQWDTHSSRSGSAVEVIRGLGLPAARVGGVASASGALTAEGFFAALEAEERTRLGTALCEAIARAAQEKSGPACQISVVLVNLAGERLGMAGDLSPWL